MKNINIDFKYLVGKNLPINKKERKIITGIDIYSATRAAYLTYDIKDIQIIGFKNK